MIGLLCLGKPDFEAIEAFREDEFFRQALGLKKVPSEGTLRQRLDELEHRCDAILREESAAMVARHAPKLTPCYEDWVALDIDPSPFDNSGTKKEGVSWTYLKFDGYNPWFAYLGNEGYLVHCQLREGSQHCQDGMPQFLDETIAYVRQITSARLAGHLDWPGLMQACRLERTTRCRGRTTVEIQYAISSLPRKRADAASLLGHWRGHWGIENRLHWVRDVSFGEDKCQVKKGHGPQNLAAFRNAAISLLRLTGCKEIAVALRDFCYRPRKLLQFLGIMKF